jgi:phospholipase/carboxylesterase
VTLVALERPAAADPAGAIVLLHGRGADQHDLHPLLDELDPERRLHGYTPRAPFPLPPGGAHWYAVPRVGYPDPVTFAEGFGALTDWFDALPFPADRVVLGGFSQGAAMSYALGLGADRPRPAALLVLSGFVPVVDGWEPDLSPPFPPLAVVHGTYDPVIPVEFGRRARGLLEEAGADVRYREFPGGHWVEPGLLPELREVVTAASGIA